MVWFAYRPLVVCRGLPGLWLVSLSCGSWLDDSLRTYDYVIPGVFMPWKLISLWLGKEESGAYSCNLEDALLAAQFLDAFQSGDVNQVIALLHQSVEALISGFRAAGYSIDTPDEPVEWCAPEIKGGVSDASDMDH